MRRKVLIFSGYYLPSTKAGGPVRSIVNIIDNLFDNFDFYVVAADRDLGDKEPFKDIESDKWLKVGNAQVLYLDMRKMNICKIYSIIKQLQCDVIYLNSFFSYRASILPVIMSYFGLIKYRKVIVAPRGQFAQGALGFKNLKKTAYITFAKLFKLYSSIYWHSTVDYETESIKKIFGNKAEVVYADNLVEQYDNSLLGSRVNKDKGFLKLVSIARIHPIKNLLQVLENLKNIDGNIVFSIYGPIEDPVYWNICKEAINQISNRVKVEYLGEIDHNEIKGIYCNHHFSILLTLGENFGHSIIESLSCGCPVIISDKTPWRNLESYNVGWDISLDDTNKIIKVLNECISMSNNQLNIMSQSAITFIEKKIDLSSNIKCYYTLFEESNEKT